MCEVSEVPFEEDEAKSEYISSVLVSKCKAKWQEKKKL